MIVVSGPRSDQGPPEYEKEVLSTILQYALQRKLNFSSCNVSKYLDLIQ